MKRALLTLLLLLPFSAFGNSFTPGPGVGGPTHTGGSGGGGDGVGISSVTDDDGPAQTGAEITFTDTATAAWTCAADACAVDVVGGGVATVAGDSGTATGGTVTVAGGAGVATSATGTTVTVAADVEEVTGYVQPTNDGVGIRTRRASDSAVTFSVNPANGSVVCSGDAAGSGCTITSTPSDTAGEESCLFEQGNLEGNSYCTKVADTTGLTSDQDCVLSGTEWAGDCAGRMLIELGYLEGTNLTVSTGLPLTTFYDGLAGVVIDDAGDDRITINAAGTYWLEWHIAIAFDGTASSGSCIAFEPYNATDTVVPTVYSPSVAGSSTANGTANEDTSDQATGYAVLVVSAPPKEFLIRTTTCQSGRYPATSLVKSNWSWLKVQRMK